MTDNPAQDDPATTEAPAPAGADATDELVEANVDLDASQGISRRRLLTAAGIGAGVLVAGGLGGWAFVRGRDKPKATAGGLTVTRSWADRELTLTTPSGVCDAPLVVAYEKGLFRQAGLNVVLKKSGTGEDVITAVGSGKYVASNGIFFNYLGPIYNGTPVKLSGGLHHGCLDLYVRNDGSVPTVASLKGKKIGVSNLQGSATNFFSLDLLDAGINSSPAAKQVEWVVIEQPLLPQALKDKKVDAIATAGGYLPIIQGVADGWAKELSNNRDISANANQPCCAVVLNNQFVSEDPVTAAKLVTAWAQGARWAGANLEETAQIESSKNYVAGTPAEILQVLKTLTFDPSPRNLRQSLQPGIEKYVKTGFLPAGVDVPALADKVFVDLGLNF
ncbi:ABC transporter substrate-binding protein [Dactylosporangium vinaceum]|uniref:ABC transporter substrate-binding protein n=1 Tax=Dactylosporangium vinaceum TaxID=53362 RepID=A0ABV5M376_9ACTN|nr:ABC transporter substrate-binding protein [Dactylosporangium vinaceum]UAB99788.1 ABC transporter substrate-binding protein [Dactylosporangium vinaceum]